MLTKERRALSSAPLFVYIKTRTIKIQRKPGKVVINLFSCVVEELCHFWWGEQTHSEQPNALPGRNPNIFTPISGGVSSRVFAFGSCDGASSIRNMVHHVLEKLRIKQTPVVEVRSLLWVLSWHNKIPKKKRLEPHSSWLFSSVPHATLRQFYDVPISNVF
jgi:hypothetical protein